MHVNQSLEYVQAVKKSAVLIGKDLQIWDIIDKLKEIHDESDPDTDLP